METTPGLKDVVTLIIMHLKHPFNTMLFANYMHLKQRSRSFQWFKTFQTLRLHGTLRRPKMYSASPVFLSS